MATQVLERVEQSELSVRLEPWGGRTPSQNSRRSDLTLTADEAPPIKGEEARRWVVLAAASTVMFVGIGYTNTFGVFQQYYQSAMFPERASSELLLIGSSASSLYLILGVFTGRFADVVGHQIALTTGSVFMIGALVAASFAQSYYHFLLSQGILFGLGIAFAYYPAITIPRQYFDSSQYGLASGIVVSGGALGGTILPYVVRISIERMGLPSTLRMLAYIAAGLLAPSTVFLRPKVEMPRGSAAAKRPLLDLSLLRDSRYLLLLVATSVAMTGFLPRYFFLPTSAVSRGVQGTYATWLLGIMSALSIAGRVGIGRFADRYGKLIALQASFVLCGLGHVIFWLPAVLVNDGGRGGEGSSGTATALFTLFVVYIGLVGSGFVALLPVVVGHLFGAEELASKCGLLNSVLGLGVLAGPSVVYVIVAAASWAVGIVVTGGLMIAGGLAISAVSRLKGPPAEGTGHAAQEG